MQYIEINIDEMNKQIIKLPMEIQQKIISYTYQFQPENLIKDITNYYITKEFILKIYYERWIRDMCENEPEDKYWLVNDIIRHLNDNRATMFGYIDKFYIFFLRNYLFFDKNKINKYFLYFYNEPINKQVNVYWGLFTSEEREEFIKTQI